MKLEVLLLRRAVACGCAGTIIQIFSKHYSDMAGMESKPWKFKQDRYLPPDSMRLESPSGSYHYLYGLFRRGGHFAPWNVIYHPHFISDVI
jgi:hypothetical protein